MSGIQLLFVGVISSVLILLSGIVGCSEPSRKGPIVSNTSSVLKLPDVDDFLTSVRGGKYCIHKDNDSSCIDLIPLLNGGIEKNGPIIHIYPERTVYLFYHEGNPIVRIERIGDTTEFVEDLEDKNGGDDNNGPNNGDDDDDDDDDDDGTDDDDDDNGNGDDDDDDGTDDDDGDNGNGDDDDDDDDNGADDDDDSDDNPENPGDDDNDDNDDNPENTDPTDNTNDGYGWLIWIYYPEGTSPINPPRLSESKVTVTINGKQLTDEDITGFAQFIGSDGQIGFQFFYPTDSAELLDLQVQMIGITDSEGDVRFNINYLWHSE